jgi:hypothetical protein
MEALIKVLTKSQTLQLAGRVMPARLWLKCEPKVKWLLGKVTRSRLWLYSWPKVKPCRLPDNVTRSRLWLNRQPNIKFLVAREGYSFQALVESVPKTQCFKALRQMVQIARRFCTSYLCEPFRCKLFLRDWDFLVVTPCITSICWNVSAGHYGWPTSRFLSHALATLDGVQAVKRSLWTSRPRVSQGGRTNLQNASFTFLH